MSAPGTRPRLAVATTYPVYPPMGGGQLRAYHLYRRLATRFDVELVALVASDRPARRRQLAPGLWEHAIPKSLAHHDRESALEAEVGIVVTDVAMSELHELTPAYGQALRAASAGARAVIACHPYVYPAIRAATDAPLWYDAHNVELELKRRALGGGDEAQRMLGLTERVERASCTEAELIWACSEEDARQLAATYDVSAERIVVVRNGADLEGVAFVSPARRRELRARLRMPDRPLAVFVASWHQPNIVAADAVIEIARQRAGTDFLVVGSVGRALRVAVLPPNLQLTGQVSAAFKNSVLSVSDVALNPLTLGSGTNLKMPEYFVAGVPVISTRFGARGLDVIAGEHYLEADVPDFAATLDLRGEMTPAAVQALVTRARERVREQLSWDAIVDRLLAELDRRELTEAEAPPPRAGHTEPPATVPAGRSRPR